MLTLGETLQSHKLKNVVETFVANKLQFPRCNIWNILKGNKVVKIVTF